MARLINKDTLKHTSVIIFILLLSFGSEKTFAQDLNLTLPVVNTNHAKALATLIVQKSADGRMVPFDTLSREILEKFIKVIAIRVKILTLLCFPCSLM